MPTPTYRKTNTPNMHYKYIYRMWISIALIMVQLTEMLLQI